MFLCLAIDYSAICDASAQRDPLDFWLIDETKRFDPIRYGYCWPLCRTVLAEKQRILFIRFQTVADVAIARLGRSDYSHHHHRVGGEEHGRRQRRLVYAARRCFRLFSSFTIVGKNDLTVQVFWLSDEARNNAHVDRIGRVAVKIARLRMNKAVYTDHSFAAALVGLRYAFTLGYVLRLRYRTIVLVMR